MVAFAEMGVGQDGRFARTPFPRLSHLEEEFVPANLERRHVEAACGGFPPVPDGIEQGKPAATEPFAPADPPVVLIRRREALRSRRDLPLALLVKPFEAAQRGQLRAENIAQRGQIKNIERGIGQEVGADRPARPVGFLAILVEHDAKMLFEQRSQADAGPTEQLGGQHGVEQSAGHGEAAEVVQQPQVKVAPVHDQVLGRKPAPERGEVKRGKHVDQMDLTADIKLEEAKARPVVVKIVCLGIERDLGDTVEEGKKRRELLRMVDEMMGRR